MNNELLTAETVTHHFIDDAVPCHEAMESFARHFPVSAEHATRSADGRTMIYPGRVGVVQACEIIDTLQLPLYATVLDGQLLITYHGK